MRHETSGSLSGRLLPRWPAPARNQLPPKITTTGAAKEGTARVINEPDVPAVAGRFGEGWGGWGGKMVAGTGLLCLDNLEGADDIPVPQCDRYTKNVIFHNAV